MEAFVQPVQVRWSDLDPNFHVRHSVYYDWGVFCRIKFLYNIGLTTEVMQRLNISPILFREECVFRKEIRLEDTVTVDLELLRTKKDFSRWSVQHEIKKNGDTLAAILTVDIAWIDTVRRKLSVLPEEVQKLFETIPLAENCQWLD